MKTFLILVLFNFAGCLQAQFLAVAPPTDTLTPETELPWSPEQATGEPDTPQPGDFSTAWAAGTLDQREEWLMLEYATPASLDSVRIYESYNPGAISKVIAFAQDGREVELVNERSADGEWTSEYRLRPGQEIQTKRVCITINEPAFPGYNEIDAVGLKAKDGSLQWAITATASSFYGESTLPKPAAPSWSTAQATGEPNTPVSGDFPTAWAPSNPDAGKEWLQTTFGSPIRARACEIFQSCGPGAITSVDLINAAGQPIATLQPAHGAVEKRPGGIEVLRIPFDSTAAVAAMRINLDTQLVPGWNEIDTVALVDQTDTRHWARRATASSAFGGQHEDDSAFGDVLIDHAAGFVETLETVKKVLDNEVVRFGSTLSLSFDWDGSRQKGAPWSPEQATAAPDTPVRGDLPSAWAPRSVAGGKEWLRLEFLEPADLDHVRVYDSNVAGAIVSIAALLPGGNAIPLRLSEEANRDSNEPRIVVGKCPEGATLNTTAILVTLDTKRTPNDWPEIDAVELVARNGARQWAARATASTTYAENLGAGRRGTQPYERAENLKEAHERIEALNQRVRALEDRIQRLGHAERVPPFEQKQPPAGGEKP